MRNFLLLFLWFFLGGSEISQAMRLEIVNVSDYALHGKIEPRITSSADDLAFEIRSGEKQSYNLERVSGWDISYSTFSHAEVTMMHENAKNNKKAGIAAAAMGGGMVVGGIIGTAIFPPVAPVMAAGVGVMSAGLSPQGVFKTYLPTNYFGKITLGRDVRACVYNPKNKKNEPLIYEWKIAHNKCEGLWFIQPSCFVGYSKSEINTSPGFKITVKNNPDGDGIQSNIKLLPGRNYINGPQRVSNTYEIDEPVCNTDDSDAIPQKECFCVIL